MKSIRIMSLGEIVKPDLGKGITALAAIIANKGSIASETATQQVQLALRSQMKAIDDFKLGAIAEDAFDDAFLTALQDKTGVKLTVDEFNAAWSAMNPDIETFTENLVIAMQFNKSVNHEMIFISYTNPKDIRQLTNQLNENQYWHELDGNGNLCKIGGMRLHLTYLHHLTKAKLVEKVIKEIHQSDSDRNSLFAASQAFEGKEIKYVYSTDKTIEALQQDIDANIATVETVNQYRVDCILWDRKDSSLLDMLWKKDLPMISLLASSL